MLPPTIYISCVCVCPLNHHCRHGEPKWPQAWEAVLVGAAEGPDPQARTSPGACQNHTGPWTQQQTQWVTRCHSLLNESSVWLSIYAVFLHRSFRMWERGELLFVWSRFAPGLIPGWIPCEDAALKILFACNMTYQHIHDDCNCTSAPLSLCPIDFSTGWTSVIPR